MIDDGSCDERRVERERLAHPLRNEPLLTTLGHDPKMAHVGKRLGPAHENNLAGEGMIGITDDDRFCGFTMMMGSMLILRSAVRSRCSSTWPATPIGWRSAIIAWSSWKKGG